MLSARVEGGERAYRALSSFARRLRDLSTAWRAVGARIIRTAVPLTPVLTGRLVRTLKAVAGPEQVTVSAGGGDVLHAGVQNYGWPARNIAARHFLDGAVDRTEPAVDDEVLSVVQTMARRAGLT